MALIQPVSGGYEVGKGRLYFRPNGSATLHDLGDSDGFALSSEQDVLDRFATNTRTRTKAASDVRSTTHTASTTLVQLTPIARALRAGSDIGTLTQAASVSKTLTVAAVAVGDVFKLDGLDVTITTVTDGEAVDPVAYTAGTHYQIEAATGLMKILALPDGAGAGLEVVYAVPEITAAAERFDLGIGSLSEQEGYLLFRSLTERADQPETMAEFWRCKMRVSGEAQRISEEYQTVPVAFEFLADPTKAERYRIGREVQLTREPD